MHVNTGTYALVITLGIGGAAIQPSAQVTQSFDQPAPGARSPRNANYDIDVRLDRLAHMLKGHETIHWRNISSQATSELQFHVYWNAWRNLESSWLSENRLAGSRDEPRRPEDWGWSEVSGIRLRQADGATVDVTSRKKYISPDDGNPQDRTVFTVPLPAPVPSNGTIEVEIDWTAKIPFAFTRLRTGWIRDYYFIVQWFPKVGVLEDSGWNTHQFHSATEFYADYGIYDVRMTVPRGWILGASGREVEKTDNADGTTTHRYHGEDIHDFAWTTSPRFIDARQTFEHPTLPKVEMRLLLQPEHAEQAARHFAATVACLKNYGEWYGAYPYGYITIVDPAYQSGSGGMEYPTLFTAGSRWLAPKSVTTPEGVTVHEAGHQFWYGMVGNNEYEDAWMDEGFNTFSTARAVAQAFTPNYLAERYFDGFVPWVFYDVPLSRETDGNRLAGYRDSAKSDIQATPTFRYWPGSASVITYNKTALWLNTLERHLGWPTLQKIMSTHFERWKFRHPKPADFFQVANEVTGQDLTWYFDQVYRSSNVFDYGVQEFRSDPVSTAGYTDSRAGPPTLLESRGNGPYHTIVVVRRYGEAIFPVDVVTTFSNGAKQHERWDGRDRHVTYVYERAAQAVSTQVDPKRVLLLDVNYTNNSWTLEPRGDEASLKWALKWMVWMQQLMLTYGFLA
jgi:aminopeptidase N